jgi:hypothetical protein
MFPFYYKLCLLPNQMDYLETFLKSGAYVNRLLLDKKLFDFQYKNYMKKTKEKSIALLLFGFAVVTAQAQQATTATGGTASGSGGTVAYSVGQVVYTTNTGSNGSVAQGVQQPYEIFVELGVENPEISLTMQAYPNPTFDNLTLNVGNNELSNLNFQLIDLNGRVIENRIISNAIETIGMENVAAAVYFLKVTRSNTEIKTFKIIKK